MPKLVLGSVCAWWRGELREGGGAGRRGHVRGTRISAETQRSPGCPGDGIQRRTRSECAGGAAVGNRQCSMQGRGENNNSSAAALLRHAHPACTGVPCPSPPRSPPPPAHCHPDQGWWSHARCGRRPRRRGEGAVDWGPCMQATLTCSTGGCCPNPRFACVPLNPAPITMTSWWERKQGVCVWGGGVCVGVWRGRHGVGACGQDRPTSVSTQPHNTAWRPQPTPRSMRAGRVQGTCLRVWGHTLKQ